MEVPGQLAVPLCQDSNLYCLPCERDGLKESAHGYCQDCEEHLCESCYQLHRKPRPLRNHVLLAKDSMPRQPKSWFIRSDEITDLCTKHSDKPIEFFCNKHGSTVCYVCVTLEHKHCNVDYIPDVSESMSDELNDLVERMEKLIEKCKSNVRIAEKTVVNLELSFKNVFEAMKLFRKEINKYLDRMESAMTREAKALEHSAKLEQENIKAENLQIVDKMSCSLSLLNSLNGKSKWNKLFIEMKNFGPRLAIFSDKERQTVKDNKTDDDFIFIRNDSILDMLKNENSFGTISAHRPLSEDRAVIVKNDKEIDLSSSSDTKKCDFLEMVLVSTKQMIVYDIGKKNKID